MKTVTFPRDDTVVIYDILILVKKKKVAKNKNTSLKSVAASVASKPYYISVVMLWGLYLLFLFNSPNTASAQLHISEQAVNLLRLTIAIPYLLIWLTAAYSFTKIKSYAQLISPSRESSAYHKIANGILFLFISLIVSTLMGSLRTFFGDYADTRPIFTILTNYAYILPYLCAFTLILRGTIELSHQPEELKISLKKYIVCGVPFILFAYVWLELIFTNQTRLIPGEGNRFATYYLKDSLLVLTVVIPSLITWFVGLVTVLKLWLYRRVVKGIIYKRALSSLVYGLTGVVFGSIILQALLSLGNRRLLDLGLAGLLGVIYVFIFIQIVGFLLIARSAKKLTKIEAV
ncbi:MAG: hypothetical protein H0W89_04415 [Candidatus Levybacteria bacterium]|nr:hypothetical protein [Candidatus Levybacteria bacterium]